HFAHAFPVEGTNAAAPGVGEERWLLPVPCPVDCAGQAILDVDAGLNLGDPALLAHERIGSAHGGAAGLDVEEAGRGAGPGGEKSAQTAIVVGPGADQQ